jgi:outer membrane protein assembly factor BamE (lipoprotein component of BamABCDE complex)
MRIFIYIFIVFGFVGCFSSGVKINRDIIDIIKVDNTTQLEVLKLLGEPSAVSESSDSTTIFVYTYLMGTVGFAESQVLSITFKNNIVKNKTFSTSTVK